MWNESSGGTETRLRRRNAFLRDGSNCFLSQSFESPSVFRIAKRLSLDEVSAGTLRSLRLESAMGYAGKEMWELPADKMSGKVKGRRLLGKCFRRSRFLARFSCNAAHAVSRRLEPVLA